MATSFCLVNARTLNAKEFAEKYSLPFSLLADIDGDMAKSYGVLTKFMGMTVASRQSFIINPEGVIAKHYEKVDPDVHSEEVLADIKAMM